MNDFVPFTWEEVVSSVIDPKARAKKSKMSKSHEWIYWLDHPNGNAKHVSSSDLRDLVDCGTVKRDTPVRHTKWNKWKRANQVAGLAKIFNSNDTAFHRQTNAIQKMEAMFGGQTEKDLTGQTENLTKEQQMWYHHPITIIAAFIIFWPVGLGLLVTHPKVRGSWKTIGGAAAIGVFAIFSLGCFMACLGVGSPDSPGLDTTEIVAERIERIPTAKVVTDPKTSRFQRKVDAWRQEQKDINSAITELASGRRDLLTIMRKAGKDAPLIRTHAEEILELDGQVAFLNQKTKTYSISIGKADSALRRIKRRKLMENVGVSEKELDELAKTVYELDNSLEKMSNDTSTIELDVDDILKEAFPQ